MYKHLTACLIVLWSLTTSSNAMEKQHDELTRENLPTQSNSIIRNDLTLFEASCIILSRLSLSATDSYLKSSLETIFGLLITREKADLFGALSMLKIRFVDAEQTSSDTTLAASLWGVFQQPNKATKWGISPDNKLLPHKAAETEELSLSPYENSIIRMNRVIPWFWANIEVRKDAGRQHIHVCTLSLLTKPPTEAISILENRAQRNQELVDVLEELKAQ